MESIDSIGPIGSLAFAGGGCRCFWQAGFLEVVLPALPAPPRAVSAVSAGAAMACLVFGGKIREGLAEFQRRVQQNQRNARPQNALLGRPIFPHAEIYRSSILQVLDEKALAQLRRGPTISVLLARARSMRAPRANLFAGALAFGAERMLLGRVHPRWGHRLGVVPELVSLASCGSAEAVADLILHSSCTPPVTPPYFRDGRPVLDGGIYDRAPAFALAGAAPTLVLLTAREPPHRLPQHPGRIYVQPSKPLPIAVWNFADARGVQAAFDFGRRDGEAFLSRAATSFPSPAH